jgi:hypothetical protein
MTDLWFKRSCTLGQHPEIQAVALKHGGLSILVFEELMSLCKQTRGGGTVETTWAVVATRCYATLDEVRTIVDALAGRGLVTVDESSDDDVAVTIDNWAKWNPKDPTNAERQARHRSRNAPRNGARNGAAVDITVLEEEKENREPPKSPASGGRARERRESEQEVADYAAWLLPAAPEPARSQAVAHALAWLTGRGEVTTPGS